MAITALIMLDLSDMVVFWWMNDWSILSASLSLLEGEPQAALKRLPPDGLPVHVRSEELEIIAPAFLGVVHGCIRTLDEHFRIASECKSSSPMACPSESLM